MTDSHATTLPDDAKKNQSFVRIVLLLLIVWTAVCRLYCYDEPLERDITTYAVAGHEICSGAWPYVAFWDHKPPGIHAVFALFELIAGYGPTQIYLLSVIAALVTLAGVYVAAKKITVSTPAALWAAAAWAVLSMNVPFQANQPNTEVVINACLIWLFALYVSRDLEPLTWRAVVAVGLLAALASQMKHVALAPVAVIGLADVALAAGDRTRRFIRLCAVGLVVCLAWAAVWALFASAGHGREFYEAVFVFNREYAGSIFNNLLTLFGQIEIMLLLLAIIPPAVAAMLIHTGTVAGSLRPHILAISYALGSLVAIVAPGQGYSHYYQLLLPSLALAVASTAQLCGWIPTRRHAALPRAFMIALVALLWINHLAWYRLPVSAWSKYKYGDVFISGYAAAHAVSPLLEPDENLFVLGMEPEFYFVTGKRMPARLMSHQFLASKALGSELTQRTLGDLEQSRPEMIVVNTIARNMLEKNRRFAQSRPLLDWIDHNYDPVDLPQLDPDFHVAVLRNSPLSLRLTPDPDKLHSHP